MKKSKLDIRANDKIPRFRPRRLHVARLRLLRTRRRRINWRVQFVEIEDIINVQNSLFFRKVKYSLFHRCHMFDSPLDSRYKNTDLQLFTNVHQLYFFHSKYIVKKYITLTLMCGTSGLNLE